MHYLHARIDVLGMQAEEALEEIPTEISTEEFLQHKEWTDSYFVYEKNTEYIEAMQAELEYGNDVV